jgi:hypothetical protein
MTVVAKKFDLCVIGAGPGGYVAAIRAAQLGLKVGIVEANHLGGICLNWGCIPTKALLKSSEVHHMLHNLESYGFAAEKITFDFAKIIERSRSVSKKLSGGIGGLMKKLIYLSQGLSIILGFIGLKLIFEASHFQGWDKFFGVPIPEISLGLSLSVILGVLVMTTALSLIKGRKQSA